MSVGGCVWVLFVVVKSTLYLQNIRDDFLH